MQQLFESINSFFQFIVPISDFLWDFPTNYSWYSNIPILGRFSLALVLLVGAGVFFTARLRFIQITHFRTGLRVLIQKRALEAGVSPLSAFMLSSAMRVGPGNIMGVTGAVSVGGPGALFWMWMSAFFGMATAYVESVLAQIYKERKGNEFVGGVPFYGRALLGGGKWVGTAIATILIVAFLMNVPGQTFHLFTSLGKAASLISGHDYDRTSPLYYGIAVVLAIATPAIILGGMRRVTKLSDLMVPVMAAVYALMAIAIIVMNYDKIPLFFTEVFAGAFAPRAIFGGAFGLAILQGVKRGLMSNEAGQGTITAAAAVSSNSHPCEQGLIQSIGVFFDTMIICSLSGFVVVMAQIWTGDAASWDAMKASKIDVYMTSLAQLVPGQGMDIVFQVTSAICYAMFAFTTLIGLISFSEISVNRISQNRTLVLAVRAVGSLLLVPFGCLTVLAKLELGNLWYISDFSNILLVFVNVPLILIGFRQVRLATAHYLETKGGTFDSKAVLGMESECWGGKPHSPQTSRGDAPVQPLPSPQA